MKLDIFRIFGVFVRATGESKGSIDANLFDLENADDRKRLIEEVSSKCKLADLDATATNFTMFDLTFVIK